MTLSLFAEDAQVPLFTLYVSTFNGLHVTSKATESTKDAKWEKAMSDRAKGEKGAVPGL